MNNEEEYTQKLFSEENEYHSEENSLETNNQANNETKQLFEKPQHPYTKNLLSSIPNIGGKRVIETFTPMGAPPDQVEYLNKGNNA